MTHKQTGKGKYVLIAEDDNFFASIYKQRLAELGYDVEIVGNGRALFDILPARKPDLIMLDVIMPEMDGFDVIEKLKKDGNYKDVKVLVLSNLGQEEDVQKAKDLGADGYIVKSGTSMKDVVNKIKEVLGG